MHSIASCIDVHLSVSGLNGNNDTSELNAGSVVTNLLVPYEQKAITPSIRHHRRPQQVIELTLSQHPAVMVDS